VTSFIGLIKLATPNYMGDTVLTLSKKGSFEAAKAAVEAYHDKTKAGASSTTALVWEEKKGWGDHLRYVHEGRFVRRKANSDAVAASSIRMR
jgi:hypothetical protein